MIRFETCKLLDISSRPTDFYAINLLLIAQAKVQQLARLAEESFAGAQRLDQWPLVAGQDDFNAGADRIAIGRRAVALELQRQKVMVDTGVVAQELHSWGGAIGCPQVEIAVVVPIHERIRPTIADVVQSGGGRNVGKPFGAGV